MASLEKDTKVVTKTIQTEESVYTLELTQDEMDALRTILGNVSLIEEVRSITSTVEQVFGSSYWIRTPFEYSGTIQLRKRK